MSAEGERVILWKHHKPPTVSSSSTQHHIKARKLCLVYLLCQHTAQPKCCKLQEQLIGLTAQVQVSEYTSNPSLPLHVLLNPFPLHHLQNPTLVLLVCLPQFLVKCLVLFALVGWCTPPLLPPTGPTLSSDPGLSGAASGAFHFLFICCNV